MCTSFVFNMKQHYLTLQQQSIT